LGSCGRYNTENDFIVALSLPENSEHHRCFQHIQIHYRGRTIEAQVMDSCPGCQEYDLDLSPAVFTALAPTSVGRIQVTWNFV
ncbi:RlpA-like double-psi beta-barrel-protein domain-containing protein-containing protein, partial [Coprinopsis sp. MPI-PUGE-AT-0042]